MILTLLNSTVVFLGPMPPLSWALWIHVYIRKLKEIEDEKSFWLQVQFRVCTTHKIPTTARRWLSISAQRMHN